MLIDRQKNIARRKVSNALENLRLGLAEIGLFRVDGIGVLGENVMGAFVAGRLGSM